MNYTLMAPFTKLTRALKERGAMGTLIQLYTIGDLKFGELKGTDQFGNKYFENIELPYGQHRWVEYADIHNPDPTMITPDWHGWMHHTFDETPSEYSSVRDNAFLPTTKDSHAIYKTHLSHTEPVETADKPQTNVSQFRRRGYKIGSLMSGPEDPDVYYKQPGHPLHPNTDKGGRFNA